MVCDGEGVWCVVVVVVMAGGRLVLKSVEVVSDSEP